ncbi:MAG: alpha/beta fold hydrolase [Thermomicrobiales bacterium]
MLAHRNDHSSSAAASRFAMDGLSGDLHGDDATRPGIVLLHGLSFNRRIWDPVVAELSSLDPTRRVLALDLPGHGDSYELPSYDMDAVTDVLHAALQDAGFGEPLLVGHSIAAVIATVYGARFPARGVVNVDQPLQTAPFGEMLRGMAAQLRSPAFPSIWAAIARDFHTELLPAGGRERVEATSNPRQEVVLGYWRQIMDAPTADLVAFIDLTLTRVREQGLPYLVIGGWQPEPGYLAWLHQQLPQARVVILPESGHFPFLAHPERFAREILDFAANVQTNPHQ